MKNSLMYYIYMSRPLFVSSYLQVTWWALGQLWTNWPIPSRFHASRKKEIGPYWGPIKPSLLENKSLFKLKIGSVTLNYHHNNDKAMSAVISSRRERRLGAQKKICAIKLLLKTKTYKITFHHIFRHFVSDDYMYHEYFWCLQAGEYHLRTNWVPCLNKASIWGIHSLTWMFSWFAVVDYI